MQGVATNQHLRSTLHPSQPIVCRSTTAGSASRRAYSAIRASGRIYDTCTAHFLPLSLHNSNSVRNSKRILLLSGNNQNRTGSMDSDAKRTTVAESISKDNDIVFLLRLISISFAGELKTPPPSSKFFHIFVSHFLTCIFLL